MDKRILLAAVALVAALAALPLVPGAADSYAFFLLFLFFTYTIIGQSWNLVAGYTGQVSLGQHAFFGLGAYTAAAIWSRGLLGADHAYYFDPFTLLLSGLVAAAFAVMIGLPLLSRLRGDYFALGTLGFGEIVRVAMVKGGSWTGGPFGMVLPSGLYESLRPHYWLGLALAAGVTLLVAAIRRSRSGLALVAIRDDEMAAAANGVDVLRHKVTAFATGAFFTGLAGCLQAWYLFHVSPEGFLNLNWTLYPILVTVIGGSGTVLGPVIGALVVTLLFSWANLFFPEIHPIFSGLAIILVMLFLPNGIMRMRLRGAPA